MAKYKFKFHNRFGFSTIILGCLALFAPMSMFLWLLKLSKVIAIPNFLDGVATIFSVLIMLSGIDVLFANEYWTISDDGFLIYENDMKILDYFNSPKRWRVIDILDVRQSTSTRHFQRRYSILITIKKGTFFEIRPRWWQPRLRHWIKYPAQNQISITYSSRIAAVAELSSALQSISESNMPSVLGKTDLYECF